MIQKKKKKKYGIAHLTRVRLVITFIIGHLIFEAGYKTKLNFE